VFQACKINDVEINGADLDHSKLLDCSLNNVSCHDDPIQFSGVLVERSTLTNCTWYNSLMVSTTFSEVKLCKSNLWKTTLYKCHLLNSTLLHTGFNETTIMQSTFQRSDIESCRFRLIEPQDTAFEDCRIATTLFEGSDLTNAIFFCCEFDRNLYGESTEHPTKI
jgi:uncharacterized protein YjbI with pentapeptide repeats